jgi:maltooligosyltrehalose trehalohydrolase
MHETARTGRVTGARHTNPGPGAHIVDDGVLFRVWAPRRTSLTLVLEGDGKRSMARRDDGYFELHVPGVGGGQRYCFELEVGTRADPASRFQPNGVFGPSMVVDHASFAWTDAGWGGAPPPHRQVIYELHVGTFTHEGTWAGAAKKLPELAALGVTTVEIMPIAEFSGRFGWGYDGVFFFAPFHRYGAPDDLRAFVDAAHATGLAVILDVVYNHCGPVGSVLNDFSDRYFSQHQSDWGAGFNLDGEESQPVRDFMRANARQWIEHYHFDGLRFDAVHALVDQSPEHILDELSRNAREAAGRKPLFIVGENEAQDVRRLKTPATRQAGLDSMWNEDFHHAAFVRLTGRREAYFTDYWGTANEFASMARWGCLYQGQWYSWQKNGRGTDTRALASSALVCFLENHDQIANTGFGERLHHSVDPCLWRAMTALLLLGPGVPMLFQGQERASRAPFTYFADHEGDLAQAVRNGRIEFLAQFLTLRDPEMVSRIPDPTDERGFRRCQLDWQPTPEGGRALKLHGDLLRLRREDPVISQVGTADVEIASAALTEDVLVVRYRADAGERMLLLNLGERVTLRMNDALLATPFDTKWSMAWCSERVDYGGRGVAEAFGPGQWDLQARCAWLLELR